MLREEWRLSFRMIQRCMKWRFGLILSMGQLVALTHGTAERGRGEYGRWQKQIRASRMVYGEEAGWRKDTIGVRR